MEHLVAHFTDVHRPLSIGIFSVCSWMGGIQEVVAEAPSRARQETSCTEVPPATLGSASHVAVFFDKQLLPWVGGLRKISRGLLKCLPHHGPAEFPS